MGDDDTGPPDSTDGDVPLPAAGTSARYHRNQVTASDPGRTPDAHRRTDGYVSRWSTGRLLLLGPDGVHRQLAGSAAAVWSVLDQPGTVTEVLERLSALGAVPVATDPASVAEALAALGAEGLVVAPGSGAS